jgi:RHS repeat-associated protein
VHSSVSQLINKSGQVRASYGYDAYGGADARPTDGQALTSGDTNDLAPLNPYRYSGRRIDSGTASSGGAASPLPNGSGGYDMGARRYGPDIAGFLQQDMYHGALANLGLSLDPLTQNRYALAGGNPISYIETDGHRPTKDGGGGAAPCTSIKECERRIEQRRQERWLAEYDKAIDDLPAKYHAREVLSDPDKAESMGGEIVGALVDKRFCERVGNEECAAAFEFLAASIFVVTVAPQSLKNLEKGDESAKIVTEATKRQLAGGWSKVIADNLSEEEMTAYQNDLKNKRWGGARKWLGTALHRAVFKDLDQNPNYRGRFEYTPNRRPDILDRDTKVRVELTTWRSYLGHLARGGLYRDAWFVLYRGPGQLPPGYIRGGGDK